MWPSGQATRCRAAPLLREWGWAWQGQERGRAHGLGARSQFRFASAPWLADLVGEDTHTGTVGWQWALAMICQAPLLWG